MWEGQTSPLSSRSTTGRRLCKLPIFLPLLLQSGYTALMRAAMNGKLTTVELLINSGANVDTADEVSITITT